MTGADLLVQALHAAGVRVVFGMPGSHTVAIYDAIQRHGGVRTILMRNEQAAAFAADGYARVTGRPGVVCTTAGPGATNALTGVAEAWADSMPVLLLAGQVNHDRLHQECGNYHEIDLESILRPCTKYVGTVMANDRIPAMVADAWRALTTGRPRPAALILPQDLMAAPAAALPIQVDLADSHPPLPQDAIEEAVRLLAEATHPVILAGGGAVWADAAAEIRRLAERLGCPVVTSLNAKGILDEREPHALGHARSLRGRVATTHADVMLAIGCRFTEVMTGFRKMPVPERLIQIDLNPGEIGMNYPARVGIVADAKDALKAILARLPDDISQFSCASDSQTLGIPTRSASEGSSLPREDPSLALRVGMDISSDWRDLWPSARAASRPNAEWLIETLRAELPDDAVVFTDASEMAYRMHTDYPAYLPRSFFYPSNYIALGWGFPAAVGAAVALPERVVVSFSGDGGFVMTCQELATAARYRLRMIILVHNDSAYGAIKHLQRIKFDGRYRDTELNNPDFGRLAEAFGIPSRKATDATSFREALRSALLQDGPMLIEIPDEWRYLRH